MPPLADHDIVFTEIDLADPKLPQKPRTIWMYKIANWEQFSSDLKLFKNQILNSNVDDVETMWKKFTDEIAKLSKNTSKQKPSPQNLNFLGSPINKCNKAHKALRSSKRSADHAKFNKTNAQAIPPRRYGLQLHLCRISAI